MGGTSSKKISAVSDKGPFTFIYFPIEGAGEKVRLAFVLAGIPFEDKRLPFDQWAAYKPKTKYGQVPILQIGDGEELYQSAAMLKYVALAQTERTLYPEDPVQQVLVDEMCALCDDFSKAWTPCVYAGMRPAAYGYPADMPKEEKDALVKKLREKWLADDLPRFCGYFTKALEAAGPNAFLTGPEPTIADCVALPMFRYYTKGIADHVPTDCLKPYPAITAYIERVMAIPAVAKWYEDKK